MYPKPKKPSTAYIIFNAQFCRQAASRDESSYTEMFKQAAESWATLSKSERAHFDDLAKKDKVRYQKQLDELKQTESYFTLEDGTKSTDPVNKKLFKGFKPKETAAAAVSDKDETAKAVDVK